MLTYIVIAVTGTVEETWQNAKRDFRIYRRERNTGLHFWYKEKKMGIRGSATYELIFTDCRIPKDNLLARRARASRSLCIPLDGGRIGIAAQALGLAEGALERTVAYVKERKQFSRTIGQFQNTQFQLG